MMATGRKIGEPVSGNSARKLVCSARVMLAVLVGAIAPEALAAGVGSPSPVLIQQTSAIAPIRLIVDFDGEYYWNGLRVSWAEVERRLGVEAQRTVQPDIHIEPHKQVAYHYVGAALEAAKRLGLHNVSIIGGDN